MKSILIFMSITKSITIRVDENRREYMLFRIHVYLFEHKLAVEADEKKMSTEILFLRRKDKKH